MRKNSPITREEREAIACRQVMIIAALEHGFKPQVIANLTGMSRQSIYNYRRIMAETQECECPGQLEGGIRSE